MNADTTPPQDQPAAIDSTSEERTLAMLCHLLPIFTWFIGPLIVWLIKKDSSAFVDDQGKEALNFQITIGLAYVAVGILTCITLGLGSILSPVVWAVNLVFCILACVASYQGQRYRYPVTLRLIK